MAELIVIENKLKADEGKDQTKRYAKEESINGLYHRLCPEYRKENVNASFIFLTLFPDQEQSSKKFITKRHSNLSNIFGNKTSLNNLAEILIFDWISLIKAFYLHDSKTYING